MVRGFLTALRYTAMVALPLAAFMAILAEPLTIGLFGEQWRPAISAAQVVSVGACVNGALRLRERLQGTRPTRRRAQARGAASGCADHRLAGVCQPGHRCRLVGAGGDRDRGAAGDDRDRSAHVRLDPAHRARSDRPPVLASAGLAIVLVVVQHAISAPWPAIIAGAGGGAVLYIGLLILLAPDTLSRLKTMAIPRPARPEFKLEMMQSAVDPLDEASPNGT
jgi:hypothetical protein